MFYFLSILTIGWKTFIPGCFGSCQNDKFHCRLRWKCRQNEDISFRCNVKWLKCTKDLPLPAIPMPRRKAHFSPYWRGTCFSFLRNCNGDDDMGLRRKGWRAVVASAYVDWECNVIYNYHEAPLYKMIYYVHCVYDFSLLSSKRRKHHKLMVSSMSVSIIDPVGFDDDFRNIEDAFDYRIDLMLIRHGWYLAACTVVDTVRWTVS